MSRRIEIQPAPQGMARIETYVGSRRTNVSEAMPLGAARLRAEVLAGASGAIVDHTALGHSAV